MAGPRNRVSRHKRVAVEHRQPRRIRRRTKLGARLCVFRRRVRRAAWFNESSGAGPSTRTRKLIASMAAPAIERGVAPGVDVCESRADRIERASVDRARRQRHVDLVHLPDEAHVGRALDCNAARRNARFGEQRTPFGLQFVQGPVDRRGIEAFARCAPDWSARARS